MLLPVLLIGCPREPQVTWLANEAYFEALISHITQAQHEIVISMFLFAPGDHENNRATQVKEALSGAMRRGVQVRLLLDISEAEDFSTEANRGVARALRRQGMTVQFDSPAQTTHTKLVIIDQRYVLLGSHNFTHSALRHNNEASVLVDSSKLAQQALAYVQRIGDLSGQESRPGLEPRRLPRR